MKKDYPSNVDLAVVYPRVGLAEPWDGLVSIEENPVTIQQLVRYREGHAFQDHRAERDFSLTVSCYACPESILLPKMTFGLAYRLMTTNGYEINLVYNGMALPTDSVFDKDNAKPFGLFVSTTPVPMPVGLKPSAHLVVDVKDTDESILAALEAELYGTRNADPRLPDPDQVFRFFKGLF
jgi:hypothetical protein